MRWGSHWLEIVVVVGIRRLGLLLGAIPGDTRRGLSDGVVSNVAREGGRGRANGSSAAPSRLHAIGGQLSRAEVGESSGVHTTGGCVGARGGSNVRSARSVGRVVSDGHRAQSGRGNVSGDCRSGNRSWIRRRNGGIGSKTLTTNVADRGGGVGEAHILKARVGVVSVDVGRVHQFGGLAVVEGEMLESSLHCKLQMS